jgi:hypothetical protein
MDHLDLYGIISCSSVHCHFRLNTPHGSVGMVQNLSTTRLPSPFRRAVAPGRGFERGRSSEGSVRGTDIYTLDPSICNARSAGNLCSAMPLSLFKTVRYDISHTMSETSIQIPTGFSQLSKAEQVRYIQALWDQISERPEEIPVPESHLQLAEERLRRYRENPSAVRPASEVIDRLSKRSR